MRGHTENFADLGSLHLLCAQLGVEAAMACMPSPVIPLLQTLRFNFGHDHEFRQIYSAAVGAPQAQQHLVVLQRTNAVFDALKVSLEESHLFKSAAPESKICA